VSDAFKSVSQSLWYCEQSFIYGFPVVLLTLPNKTDFRGSSIPKQAAELAPVDVDIWLAAAEGIVFGGRCKGLVLIRA
jgi:hypothetical protein